MDAAWLRLSAAVVILAVPVSGLAIGGAGPIAALLPSMVEGQYTLSVRPSASGAGASATVAIDVDGDLVDDPSISCALGSTCTASVPGGTTVVLRASPGANTTFTSWSGCTATPGDATRCSFTMTAARGVYAYFKPTTYTLTAKKTAPGGAGGTIAANVAGVARPDDPPGIDCGTNCSEAYANVSPAQAVTLTATPDAGSRITGWSGCSSSTLGPPATCTVSMSSARTVTATFAVASYPVTVAWTGGNGTITGPGISCSTLGPPGNDCQQLVAVGGSLQLTATPDAMSTFVGWGAGCASYVAPSPVCNVTNVQAARTVTATFKAAACGSCHGTPPPPPHYATLQCGSCHDGYASDAVNMATHLDGDVDVSCGGCHGLPPEVGAHLSHYGLTIEQGMSGYGDTSVLQDRFPGATPTSAPEAYGFGCGSCHPLDLAQHRNGTLDVSLRDAAAPAGSLKARAAPTAAYDPASGTCSGVYCHSSGQQSPAYVATPAWTSGASLGCAGCHANPPRYTSGGPATATANSHLGLADDGYEYGHFLGLMGPWHTSQHGGNYPAGGDAAPITCQTCHADTTDPQNTGPSGFYYLDTTGSYQLPGGAPYRIQSGWSDGLRCDSCHSATSPTAPLATGKTLPLRHVNGTRDVVFDRRTALPAIPWLPAAPNTPLKPYWMTHASLPDWPDDAVWSGSTVSFDLTTSTYDPATKTCGNVGCHLAESPVVWGTPYLSYDFDTCSKCHPNF